MDQRAPNPAIAVREGVDGLELRVDQRSLNQRRMNGPAEIRGQIRHQPGHLARRRRDEVGIERVPVTSPDPVLPLAEALLRMLRQQRSMQVADGDRLDILQRGQDPRCLPQSDDVVRHQASVLGEPGDRPILGRLQLSKRDLLR